MSTRDKTYKRWTAADDRLLRKVFADKPTKQVARALRRPWTAVSMRASKLGLTKSAAYLQFNDSSIHLFFGGNTMSAVATKTKAKAAPTKKAPPALTLITIPAMAKGEQWAGIMLLNGRPDRHVILLPGEQLDIDWTKSGALAKKQHKDGRLPTPPEQCLLRANLPGRFKPRAYWSSQQSAYDVDWAWYQNFTSGYQNYSRKSLKLACRAVRSIAI